MFKIRGNLFVTLCFLALVVGACANHGRAPAPAANPPATEASNVAAPPLPPAPPPGTGLDHDLTPPVLLSPSSPGGDDAASNQLAMPNNGAPGPSTTIAILLPLSGSNKALGEALLNAAELGVFDFADHRFNLRSYDTDAAGAAAAAQQALSDGARLILGPLFSRQVGEVALLAKTAGVNVISFSSDREIAGNGVFIMGLPPSQSIRRTIAYAKAQGLDKFAALLPSDPLGQRINDTINNELAPNATLLVDALYPPETRDFTEAVKRVAEFDRRHVGGAIAAGARSADAARRAARLQTSGAVDYQALILAESGERLRLLSTLLGYYDIDIPPVRLIGTAQWEDASLARESVLRNAWFAAPDPAARANFEGHYKDIFERSPARLATLSYDATGLAAVLARQPSGPDFSAAALTSVAGFAGADGLFRWRADGIIERGLAILTLSVSGVDIVDPAPASFEAPKTD